MWKKVFAFLLCLTWLMYITPGNANAIADPLSTANNKFGIHIISPTTSEASSAASLVNSSGGDWGYVTVLIESKDRDSDKWQGFFDELRRYHLIPIVRIATKPVGNYWEKPSENDANQWTQFLDSLNWPTKNRYVVIYNEPNHAKEWGNKIDPLSYATILSKTRDTLKEKNTDFFVLNAGLDASAPHQPPNFFDEEQFLIEMQKAVPGIFDKLDGWVSHSYPNPGFIGKPTDIGRGTIGNFRWELSVLSKLGVKKQLPVFITETGWKHAEGLYYDKTLPLSELVGQHLEAAFENSWNDRSIIAVTPFLLNYQQEPFDHFSFKKLIGEDYYSQYQTMINLSKSKGNPVQENKAQLVQGEIYKGIVAGETYNITLTFKNTGQSIWNDSGQVKLVATKSAPELGIENVALPKNSRVEPGQQYSFNIKVKAPKGGSYQVVMNLFNNEEKFNSPPIVFNTEVKSPVVLVIESGLLWKRGAAGDYLLGIIGETDQTTRRISLGDDGKSDKIEVRRLLPDMKIKATLDRSFYKQKTIEKTVYSGENVLDFGTLTPDLLAAIFKPKEFWKLLPFSK